MLGQPDVQDMLRAVIWVRLLRSRLRARSGSLTPQPTRAHLQSEVAVGVMTQKWVQMIMNTLDE
jgi:hypothetical protein